MTSMIEVELPSYTIAPLDRSDEAYWKLASTGTAGQHEDAVHLLPRAESTLSMIEEGRVRGFLRGGSWRTFQWKKLLVGKKLYRIQYEDELCEPPAEIGFSDLVHFLLDWGAVPDANGWEKLKIGGLWTPAGTILLRRATEENHEQKRIVDWVLRTSISDESDGVLTLSVRWSVQHGVLEGGRGAASLPPGWGRLQQPKKGVRSGEVEKKGLADRIEDCRADLKASTHSQSFRFRIDGSRVITVYWETNSVETGLSTELWPRKDESTNSTWFTCVASVLTQRKGTGGGLFGFEIPANLLTFTREKSIPCGVMVVLDMLDDSDTPDWQSHDPHAEYETVSRAEAHHRRFMESYSSSREEDAMPPPQASIARMNRQFRERQRMMDEMQAQSRARMEKEERRVRDAIASPRLSNKAVADACLSWLVKTGEVGEEWTLLDLAEAVLYLVVVDKRDDGEATKVLQVLDEWMTWTQVGGMKKSHLTFLLDRKVEFCFAAALVCMVQDSAGATGKAGADMLECLKSWRKVRLG